MSIHQPDAPSVALKDRGSRVSVYLDRNQQRRLQIAMAKAGHTSQTRFIVERLGLDADADLTSGEASAAPAN